MAKSSFLIPIFLNFYPNASKSQEKILLNIFSKFRRQSLKASLPANRQASEHSLTGTVLNKIFVEFLLELLRIWE